MRNRRDDGSRLYQGRKRLREKLKTDKNLSKLTERIEGRFHFERVAFPFASASYKK